MPLMHWLVLLPGIGFIGGGAILKNDNHVNGTATAASIWVTGALGAAVSFRFWWIAILISGFNFAILLLMSLVKPKAITKTDQ